MKELSSFVGHVQISQTPRRDCPMNENGEVNHRYFLLELIAPFYRDFIGLEYNGKHFSQHQNEMINDSHAFFVSKDSTKGSFQWLKEFTE